MSLFENDEYQWRETFFVLFVANHRPTGELIRTTLGQLNRRYQLGDTRVDENGEFESITLYSPDDNAAMDITYIDGEEVVEQTLEMVEEMKRSGVSDEEKTAVKQLSACNARLDVYHFEKLSFVGGEDEDEEYLDPGSLLIVLEQLSELCNGIPVDPQTGAVLS